MMRHLIPWRKRGNGSRLPAAPRDLWWGEVGRLFDRLWNELSPWGADDGFFGRSWTPSLELSETDDEVLVRAEIPGVDPKAVEISLDGDRLTIAGEKTEAKESSSENTHYSERFHGSFRRTIALPVAVDRDSACAEHKDGVLTIRMKKDPKLSPKKIPVKVA